MNLFKKLGLLKIGLSYLPSLQNYYESQKLLLANLLVDHVKQKKGISSLKEVEFKVFSQWGDDGIIQWLINNIDISHKTFIEFGVEDYRESNTRFLMMHDYWSGFVMDASARNISRIIHSEFFHKYELSAKTAFVTKENIDVLISKQGFMPDVGVLHIDIDGNDYWIWKALTVIKPIIVIMEYNSVFGIDRAITVPYNPKFYRTNAHYSNLYFGTSLKALYLLARRKEYGFIGCNSAGNNAFFVRCDKLNNVVKEITLNKGYVLSKFRESRGKKGNLTYLSGTARAEEIRGMPVYNIETEQIEKF